MTVIKRVCELQLGDELAMIHGHSAASTFRSDIRGNAEVVKLQRAPNGPDRITITALVNGITLETALDVSEPVEVESAEGTPVRLPCQQTTVAKGIKRVCELQLDDMLTAIHGRPAQAELTIHGNTAKLGHEGSAAVIMLEYGDPEHPESKTIKVSAQANDHNGSGYAVLTKQEPVEVDAPAEATPK